ECVIKAPETTAICCCATTIKIGLLTTAHTVSKKGKRGKLGGNMRVWLSALVGAVCIFSTGSIFSQDPSSPAPPPAKPPSADGPSTTTSTVMRTNSMAVLDDKKK